MRYDPRVPIIEFAKGKDGKINFYERRADWLYDRSKPIDESKSKKILLASIDPIPKEVAEDTETPNDLEATLKKAAHEIAHLGRTETRWKNYLRSSNFVFIVDGDLELYRNSKITDFFVKTATESGFYHMSFDSPSGSHKESGVKIGHCYVVKNPKGIRRVDSGTLKDRLKDM